ncbi:MAG: hypothetical protein SOX43_06405 [Pelistega sp.]|nr:hypothetical protein [Pelistega sp.]
MDAKLVRIYKVNFVPKNIKQLKRLTIDDKAIKFLQPILLSDCHYYVLDDNTWYFTFFSGHSYQQNFYIHFLKLPTLKISHNEWINTTKDSFKNTVEDGREFTLLTHLVYLQPEDGQLSTELAEKASIAIRGTKAIKVENYRQGTNHFNHIDGRGLSFISFIGNISDHFERHVILLALAYAYLGAMEYLNNELAKYSDQEDNIALLTKLYEEAAKFNAKFFFNRPVQIQNTGLVASWNAIEETLKIGAINQELVSQIENVHYILNLKYQQTMHSLELQRKELDEKRNAKIALWGLVIAAISAIFPAIEFFLR